MILSYDYDKMCTKTLEFSNAEKDELNVTINKQQVKCTSNLDANEHASVDFRIHTNIEFMKHKKMKICLLINILISVVCVTTCMIVLYKVYSELLEVQSEMSKLNVRVEMLAKNCEHTRYEHEVPNMEQDAEAQALSGITDEPLILNGLENKGNGKDGNYELMQRQTLLTRLPRANRRTKDKTTRRKVKSSGTVAAHFKGSVPEVFVKDQGLIGPWYLDNSVSKPYKFTKFHLTENQCSIEVTEPALYLIYAQVYYITSNVLNSYSVVVRSEGSSENNVIARCSAVGPKSHQAELSCYTATVYSLKANDRVFLQQTEKNRTIILRDGHSFFGMIRLNYSHSNHRL